MTLITSWEPAIKVQNRWVTAEELKYKESERDLVIGNILSGMEFIAFIEKKYYKYKDLGLRSKYYELRKDKIDSAIALHVTLRDAEIYVTMNDLNDYLMMGGR